MKTYKEKCINKFTKEYPNLKISRVVNWETNCEWCNRSTEVVQIEHEHYLHDTGTVTVFFKDPKFTLQSEWWVCGRKKCG